MIRIVATGDTTIRTAKKYCEEDILVQVPKGGQPKLQGKTVTENGVVICDEGYDGLGIVEVNVSLKSVEGVDF